MATRQINVDAFELNVLLMNACNLASVSLQAGDMQTAGVAIKRIGELYPALREAIAALPKPNADAASQSKRA